MFSRGPVTLDLRHRETLVVAIAWARLAAVPFALLEVAIERGNYPPGDEGLAWAMAGLFAAAAIGLAAAEGRRWVPPVGLAVDMAVVWGFVALYSFEPGTPVRQLLVLPVLEAALLYGLRGGLLAPLGSLPVLAFFEWRQAERLDLYPLDVGHVLGPGAVHFAVGLVVGALVGGLSLAPGGGSAHGNRADDRGRSRREARRP